MKEKYWKHVFFNVSTSAILNSDVVVVGVAPDPRVGGTRANHMASHTKCDSHTFYRWYKSTQIVAATGDYMADYAYCTG